MTIDCPAMSFYRNSCSLGPYVEAFRKINPIMSAVKIYAYYLNDTDQSGLKDKIQNLYRMKIGWHSLMKIPL